MTSRGGPSIVSEQPEVYKSRHSVLSERRSMPEYASVIVTAAELAAAIGSGGLVVLDCRFDLKDPAAGLRAWHAGHIPGAHYADLDRDLAAAVSPGTGRHPLPDVADMAVRFSEWGIGSGTRVVAYDAASGAIAARAWWLLRWLGHRNVAVLDGGIDAWVAADLPLVTDMPDAAAVPFEGVPGDNRVVTTETVSSPGFSRQRLLDARDPSRFRGEHEPIDAVAGHVPGTTNLPFSETLDSAGRLKNPAALRELFASRLQGDLEAPWSVMCGSGVTACHLALAAEYAGLRAPAVYVGSFSEWISDPERPVATAADA